MGSKPTVEQKSALDPALSGLLTNGAAGPLYEMFKNPISSVGPRTILGETPQGKMFRESGISNLNAAIPGAGSFSPNESSASSFLGRTINGDFLDPTKSPVYASIADSIRRQALDASGLAGDQLNANFAGAGHFGGSGPLLSARNALANRTALGVSDQLSNFLMPLYQQQLGYQQNALPMSMQFGNLSRSLPLNQLNLVNQAYGLSDVPRSIEQSQLDEVFNAANRARAAKIEPFQILASLMGGTPAANSLVQPGGQDQWIRSLLGGGVGAGSGALTGAGIGAAGGPIGAGGGAAIGGLLGLLSSFLQ